MAGPMPDRPAAAAWRLLDAHDGFEVLFPRDESRVEGQSTGVEEGQAWAVRYAIALDAGGATRSAHVTGLSAVGEHDLRIEGDGRGGWRVDGRPAPELSGCLDVDLEGSACTNAFPVRRLGLEVGQRAEAPAVYVRAPDLRVERLEQQYERLEDDGELTRYDYASPTFGFACVLVYDRHGLVLDYPGIAVRVA
jgi:uncharacterized protein